MILGIIISYLVVVITFVVLLYLKKEVLPDEFVESKIFFLLRHEVLLILSSVLFTGFMIYRELVPGADILIISILLLVVLGGTLLMYLLYIIFGLVALKKEKKEKKEE